MTGEMERKKKRRIKEREMNRKDRLKKKIWQEERERDGECNRERKTGANRKKICTQGH